MSIYQLATTQPQDEMKSGFLRDCVVVQCSSILKLFSGINQSLLKPWNSLMCPDQPLDSLDTAIWRDHYSYSFASQGLDKDLKALREILFDEVEEI